MKGKTPRFTKHHVDNTILRPVKNWSLLLFCSLLLFPSPIPRSPFKTLLPRIYVYTPNFFVEIWNRGVRKVFVVVGFLFLKKERIKNPVGYIYRIYLYFQRYSISPIQLGVIFLYYTFGVSNVLDSILLSINKRKQQQ